MITLGYVIYDCIANASILIFAFLLYKKNNYAWLFVLASLIIKVFIYGKYGISTSLIYLSAQLLTAILAAIIWLRNPTYVKVSKQKKLLVIVIALIILAIWIGLMYQYVNPYILNYELMFGFDYLCYMLVVIGGVFLIFRLAVGLLFFSVVYISYAVNYANSAMVIQNAPQYYRDFILYYWLSALFLFIAGIIIVATYTNAKRSI
ncbi:hypothetical protein JPFTNV_19440 [Francisella tularensis subsp. holarctica]|uniref:hypothetical protein n=1 Tax=Francisella tularensis TaxID=263 RepID=UPI0007061C1F|nr:hypothetical protein [Francisella tularensis]ALK94469.1 membrane protein [Francisella tularensis]OCQ62531.1 hypothetical protein ASZ94_08210 [Francisella tularensis]BCL54059.1 hypothetical protein JPFTNV_19440 [Francisella tularensis subsp. holarctica]BCL56160.1 hypothetical protein JPFTKU_19740 [Francisella tularensis subsp. holarctica]